MNIVSLKKDILACLLPLNPEKVILFGSYAWGEPSADSDVDLYVVTRDSTMPATWGDKKSSINWF